MEINPDNFDSVLKGMQPHLALLCREQVERDPNAGQIGVNLHFESLDDFSPENVAKQVEPLKELLDLRTRLSDLRGSLQGNDKLDEALFEAVSNTESAKSWAELGKPGGEQ